MPPDQNQQTPSPHQSPQPTAPEQPAASLPFHGQRPMLDARLGFRRQFTPMQNMTGAEAPPPPSLAEQMGQGLYDDPYYRSKAPQPQRGRQKVIIISIILLVLASVASAAAFPAIKRHNPNGLFQSAGAQQ